MTGAPIIYHWDGEAMRPLGRFAKLCDKRFVVGENYRLEVIEDRSSESHRHYFASVNEAWANLPELVADRWPTAEHLRKWALVKSGYFDETTFIAKSKAEALRFAGFLRSIDGYAEVVVEGHLVARRVAKSQSMKAMSRKEFQDSKQKVLDVLSDLIGVAPGELGRAARSVA